MQGNDEKRLSIGGMIDELKRHSLSISHSNLRFLEREGLIAPGRSMGGHRLYSRADVARVAQIKSWQAQRRTLDEIRERLESAPDLASLAGQFQRLVFDGDFERARDLVLRAEDAGAPLDRLFGDVLAPALAEVGDRWRVGTLLVSQEKEISELTRQLIVQLTLRGRPSGPDAGLTIAACVEGERHEFGLRMIIGLLEARGERVQFLGPDVAPRFLAEAVRRHSPDAVLLSASTLERLPALEDTIEAVRAQANLARIFAGGRAVHGNEAQVQAWGAVPVVAAQLKSAVASIAGEAS